MDERDVLVPEPTIDRADGTDPSTRRLLATRADGDFGVSWRAVV